METTFSIWALAMWAAVMSIILLATSEVSPYLARLGVFIDRAKMRTVAILMSLVFLALIGYQVYQLFVQS